MGGCEEICYPWVVWLGFGVWSLGSEPQDPGEVIKSYIWGSMTLKSGVGGMVAFQVKFP